MKIRTLAAIVSLAGLSAVPPQASAGPPGDTSMVERFANATTVVTPGLCAPGDMPQCVGPEVAQFEVHSDICVLNGRFEGVDLPADAPCAFDLYGFEIGLAAGTKPACGAALFYTSDETTAFGQDRVNILTINGSARRIHVEGYALGAMLVFTKVVYDGPNGVPQRYAIAPPTPVQRSSGGSGVPCVSTPLTNAIMPAGSVYHM